MLYVPRLLANIIAKLISDPVNRKEHLTRSEGACVRQQNNAHLNLVRAPILGNVPEVSKDQLRAYHYNQGTLYFSVLGGFCPKLDAFILAHEYLKSKRVCHKG